MLTEGGNLVNFFYDDKLEDLKAFKELSPKGFEELKARISNTKTHAYTAEQHMQIFEALTTYWRVSDAHKAVAEQGLKCSKSVLERVVMICGRFLAKYDHDHPYRASALLSEGTMAKIEAIINAALEPHGLAVDKEFLNQRRSVTVRRTNDCRFNGHLSFFYDEGGV